MKPRLSGCVLAVALLVSSAAAMASDWALDPARTRVGFRVRHLMISSVRGDFRGVTGTVHVVDDDPTRSKIDATIDATTIDTGNTKRDEHLRSADFLDVATHPTIRFVSKRIERKADDRWTIVGDLTLHGVTREVVLDFAGPTPPVADSPGALRAGGRATATIDRTAFGVGDASVLIGKDVDITIDVAVTNRAD